MSQARHQQCSAPWFGVIAILAFALSRLHSRPVVVHAPLLLAVTSFTSVQIAQGAWWAPAALRTDLFQQAVPTAMGGDETRLLPEQEMHELVTTIRGFAESVGFRKGDDIIAMHYLPGLVYALGGRSPGQPAYLVGNDTVAAYSSIGLNSPTRIVWTRPSC